MDNFVKEIINKAAAYSSAFKELELKDNTIKDAQYFEGNDLGGIFVRAYVEGLGYSSKYYYER